MKRILLTLSYNGTAYHGWQTQPNNVTVQEVLESALFNILGKKTIVVGCSRTDAGVHAKMFCCHLDCEENIPLTAFTRGLNSILPQDIAVIDAKEVNSDFHARYCASGKTYIYNILNSNQSDPFLAPFVWRIERPLNLELMNEFCEKIIGEHDFYGFSSSGRTVENTVRTVTDCKVYRENNFVRLEITANGFLYNMVRIITGTAAEVGIERLNPDCADKVFETKLRNIAGVTAPPNGLFLERVYYNAEI
ncbi:MAG: tRNA pseudouridine(38-40) synthase TruA [Clostridia bacterium]|nr:tRNA pseudouridine(38-40) synthase TruA [Clostridia bacterium]